MAHQCNIRVKDALISKSEQHINRILNNLPSAPEGLFIFKGKMENGIKEEGEPGISSINKVDPGKPAPLTWQRQLDSKVNLPIGFTLKFQEIRHMSMGKSMDVISNVSFTLPSYEHHYEGALHASQWTLN
ncbi:hypothetical protein Pint_07578 [Pistacia integerrima]|uniref:Uncharacterized protein n=1 Tax=Pistacia integerrima TaxID=434235 RepID=A0ACC0XX99_9ROSI|nr:hypothetical protein Pint_07578 [Pistacia integerrima]